MIKTNSKKTTFCNGVKRTFFYFIFMNRHVNTVLPKPTKKFPHECFPNNFVDFYVNFHFHTGLRMLSTICWFGKSLGANTTWDKQFLNNIDIKHAHTM